MNIKEQKINEVSSIEAEKQSKGHELYQNCCKTCRHIILRNSKMSFCMERDIYINPENICGEYNNVNDGSTVT